MLCDALDGGMERGGREVREKRAMCIHVVGSLCCAAETYTMLHSKLTRYLMGTIILQLKNKLKKIKRNSRVFAM